jgi:DNA replication protein DnaC
VVNRLSAAESNRQLAREIKRYQSPRILLIDELGYLPLDKRGAELLFQVMTKRYERARSSSPPTSLSSTGRESSPVMPP